MVDADGVVYVSEDGNNRISVFTSEGCFVTSFGDKGEGPEQFSHPHSGVVYACDYGIQLFLLVLCPRVNFVAFFIKREENDYS